MAAIWSPRFASARVFSEKPSAVTYGGAFDETAVLLRELRRPGDVIVVMGSGPVNKVITRARQAPAS